MTSHINDRRLSYVYDKDALTWMTQKYMRYLISMRMKSIMIRMWWPGMRWLELTTETREGGHATMATASWFEVSGFVLQHNSPDTFAPFMTYGTATKMGLCGSVTRLVCCDSDWNKQVTKNKIRGRWRRLIWRTTEVSAECARNVTRTETNKSHKK